MPYVHTRKKMDIFTSCVTENLHFSYSDNTTLFILKNINILCVYVRENFYIYCVRTSYLYNIYSLFSSLSLYVVRILIVRTFIKI